MCCVRLYFLSNHWLVLGRARPITSVKNLDKMKNLKPSLMLSGTHKSGSSIFCILHKIQPIRHTPKHKLIDALLLCNCVSSNTEDLFVNYLSFFFFFYIIKFSSLFCFISSIYNNKKKKNVTFVFILLYMLIKVVTCSFEKKGKKN